MKIPTIWMMKLLVISFMFHNRYKIQKYKHLLQILLLHIMIVVKVKFFSKTRQNLKIKRNRQKTCLNGNSKTETIRAYKCGNAAFQDYKELRKRDEDHCDMLVKIVTIL